MDVDTLLRAMYTVHQLARYVGVVQDQIEKRLIALANSEFDAGFRALQQAARSDVEHQALLREARGRFNKALSLELGHRLAMSYLGLALCHAGLEDRHNANVTLLELAFLEQDRFISFWDKIRGRKPHAELLVMQHTVREYLFAEYRYAVPVGGGAYDFRLLQDA